MSPRAHAPPSPSPASPLSDSPGSKHNFNLGTPMRPVNATAAVFNGDKPISLLSNAFSPDVAEATTIIAKDMLCRKNEITAKNAFAALPAFTDDRVFNDSRRWMLEQAPASAQRMGQNEEQVGMWTKQMNPEPQGKRAEAFLARVNPDRAGAILQSGDLRPVEAEALAGKLTAARQKMGCCFGCSAAS